MPAWFRSRRAGEYGRSEDEIVATADPGANSAFLADRSGRAGTSASKGAKPRPGDGRAQSAGQPRGGALYAAADQPAGGADRALPGPGTEPGVDGGHLSATGRRGRAMAEGTGSRRPT